MTNDIGRFFPRFPTSQPGQYFCTYYPPQRPHAFAQFAKNPGKPPPTIAIRTQSPLTYPYPPLFKKKRLNPLQHLLSPAGATGRNWSEPLRVGCTIAALFQGPQNVLRRRLN